MANQFQWQLGHEGKGNYYPDGSVQTWNTNDAFEPHHDEVATAEGTRPAFRFYISPEGGLHDGGIGFTNSTGRPDNDVVREVANQTPAVWDGRGQVFDDFQTTPRVEDSYGSYGHAENLIPRWNEQGTYAKLAKEEGWADFHTELKLPLSARRKIRKWVDRMKWPEGSSKDDTRRYHITILSMDEYDEDFAKWAKAQMRGKSFRFESTGMDIFADEHVVLRFKSPEWTALVREWTAKAEEEGLDPHVFEPPKAHVTLGKSPSGKWPQGIPDPHVKFNTATFNINKNSGADPTWWNQYIQENPYAYHFTQEQNVPRIAERGLVPWDAPLHDAPDTQYGGDLKPRPGHVYLTPDPNRHMGPMGNPSATHRVKIDLSKLNPEQVAPDEDAGTVNWKNWQSLPGYEHITDPDLPRYNMWNRDVETNPYKSGGEWAEGNELNHPQMVQDSLTKGIAPSMAYHGAIPPEAISAIDQVGNYDPETYDDEEYEANPGAFKWQAKTATWHIAETTPAEELLSWTQTLTSQEQSQPVSIHHTSPEQLQPQVQAPVVQTPHIDPPKQPYSPYNWADNGFEESPLNLTSSIKDYEDAQYPTGCSLDTEPKEPEDEADGANGDKLVFYDHGLGASWYVTDGTDGDYISGPWSDEDEARSINRGEWHTAASAEEEMFVPGMQPQPLKVVPHTWEETEYKGPPPYVDKFTNEAWAQRRPFMYVPAQNAIHLGEPGMVHGDMYDLMGMPKSGVINGFHAGELGAGYAGENLSVFHYDDNPYINPAERPDGDKVLESLRNHTGGDIRRESERTSAFGTHPCAQCEQQIEGQICPHCGYDPQHSQNDFEKAENEWYDRAWSRPGDQPRPVPHQPMHWGPKDQATDVRFARSDLGSDQPDSDRTAGNEYESPQPSNHNLSTDANRSGISDVESSRETSIFDVPDQQSDEIPGWASKGWRLLN